MAAKIVPTVCLFCNDKASLMPTAPKISLHRDLTGQQFTLLTVQHFFGMLKNSHSYWCCLCACGNARLALGTELYQGKIPSCGCLHYEKIRQARTKHGRADTRIYQRWGQMIRRCYTPSNAGFPDYGGRGITVCDRWRTSFANFYADMGDPPPGKSLERRDNNGPYSPENCYWATHEEQSSNQRTNHLITYKGETHTLTRWSRIIGINDQTLASRLKKGWGIERALTIPARRMTYRKNLQR